MIFNSPYWKNQTRMQMLQRWVLFHSYLYYILDDSIVNDEMFDLNCRQLKQMINKNKTEYKQTKYYYCMYDFDGSTGNGYFERLTEDHKENLVRDAKRFLEYHKR